MTASVPIPSGPLKILVVDDEQALRMTLAANLEMEGFEVVEASNGQEALDRAGAQHFDAVITDIRMPGINGVELFRELKRRGTDTPVILMTAFALEGLVRDALRDGAFTVLPKPFDIGHVAATVTRAARRPVVLVVDDEERDATSIATALRAAGVRASSALDGESAIRAIARGDVDVCVLDLVMPGLSGADLAARLRNIAPDISVIAISGYAVPEMFQSVASGGAHACLRKPFDMRELAQVVAEARGK